MRQTGFLGGLLAVACMSIPASAENQAVFWVSPLGDDANVGTSEITAFRTLTKARDTVRTLNAAMTGDIVVRLMDGVHTLDSTLVLGPQDSGYNGHSVIYQTATGARPIISGGVDLSGGWELHDATLGIYRRTGVNWSFRQLYINDTRATRARAPNRDGHAAGGPYFKALNTGHPFSINKSEIGPWALNGVCEFVWLAHWNQRRGRIQDYTMGSTSTTVTLKSPESGFNLNANPQNPTYYHLENAYELLDAEGEWFLDSPAQTLYYKPRAGEDIATATVTAPKVERLLDIVGTPEEPVHDLYFSGISFRHDNWTAPGDYGYVDGQGGQAIKTGLASGYELFSPASAMVFLTHANAIRIERCTFSHGGSWGISEAIGSHHNAYVGNHFTNLASGAINLGNIATTGYWWDFPPGSSSGTVVANNLVDAVSCDYRDNVGIMALKCRDLTIEHNEVRNLPYSGISFGFEWQATGNQQSSNNRVRFNRVHKVMGLLDDGGGIYTLGAMPDSHFSSNFVHSLAASPFSAGSPNGYGNAGLYLDNGSTYKTVNSNVVDRAGSSFLAYDGSQNTADGNFYNCPLNNITKFSTWTNNLDCRNAPWPAAALVIMRQAGIQEPYHDIGRITLGANAAVAGIATASSVFNSSFPASKANDNDGTSGLWASDGVELNPWWQVDLGSRHSIYEIEIVGRQNLDQPQVRKNFAIIASNTADFSTHTVLDSVGNSEVYPYKGIYAKPVTDHIPFRYVRIQRINDAGHFNFAECRVFGLPLTELESWRDNHFQTVLNVGPAADNHDFDNDSMANLLEYALGSNPTLPDAVFPTATLETIGEQTFLTLSVARQAIQPGVSYQVEVSNNLIDWSPDVTLIQNSATLLKARSNTPLGTTTRHFIRLRITIP